MVTYNKIPGLPEGYKQKSEEKYLRLLIKEFPVDFVTLSGAGVKATGDEVTEYKLQEDSTTSRRSIWSGHHV